MTRLHSSILVYTRLVTRLCFKNMSFQTGVLINFFIPLRRAEAITSENFVPAKRDPGSTKEGSRLAGMTLFTCNSRI